jgi:hypothetical protein
MNLADVPHSCFDVQSMLSRMVHPRVVTWRTWVPFSLGNSLTAVSGRGLGRSMHWLPRSELVRERFQVGWLV